MWSTNSILRLLIFIKCSKSEKKHTIILSSIESQPKKIVVVVVVVVVFVVVVIIVGHKNLTLKLGQNWVNNK